MPSSPHFRQLAIVVVSAALAVFAIGGISSAQTPLSNGALSATIAGNNGRGTAVIDHGVRARAQRAKARSRPAPGLLFDGAQISDFGELQAAPRAISEVPDPAGSGETVMKMTVDDGDIYPITPTENPRAQALSPAFIHDGDEFWLQTKFMLPTNFPYIPGWMSLVSIYGPPFDGSSPWQIGVNEDELRWQRNGRDSEDIPWAAPVVKGQWVTVLLHERFAADGWVEMWIDGQRIEFFPEDSYNPQHEPQTDHLQMATMDQSNDGGANSAKIMQYRMAGMFNRSSVWFGPLKVGTTRESVEG